MVSKTVGALAVAALALAGGAQASTTLNSEDRVLIQITNADTHAQVVADTVGDIWQDEPLIAFARPFDLPKLAKAGVTWFERADVDLTLEGLAKVQSYGGAPFADGSILDVNGILHPADEFLSYEDVLNVKREDPGQVYNDEDWYQLYRPYYDILAKAKTYALSAPKGLNVKYHNQIATSFEGEPMPAIEFGGRLNEGRERPLYMVFNALQHAREWVGGMGALYAFRDFLRLYGEGDAEIVELLDNVRVVYQPVTNPDGFKYSWVFDRYWRKNRRPFSQIPIIGGTISTPGLRVICPAGEIGVDQNRNWGFFYNNGGSSDDACSDVHHGPYAFSEGETQGLSDFLMAKKADENADFLGGFDFHSYSALLLRPISYGFIPENECPDNQAWMIRQFAKAQENILDDTGLRYKNQQGAALYIASGGAMDWYYGNLTEGRLGSVPEMRPSEDSLIALGLLSGFSPPPNDLIPAGREVYQMMRAFLQGALPHAKGLEPRKVTDDIYLEFYGDEGYYADEYDAIQFCLEPREIPVDDEVDGEGDAEAAGSFAAADVAAESSASSTVASLGLATAAAAVAALSLF